MLYKTFTVYDQAAKASLPPFYSTTTELAQRSFGQAVNDEGTQFNKHAADYTLFEIGTWDDHTKLHADYDSAKNLGNALTYIHHPPVSEAAAADPYIENLFNEITEESASEQRRSAIAKENA